MPNLKVPTRTSECCSLCSAFFDPIGYTKSMALSLHSITTLGDDTLPAVLDFYQQSFPANEQMRLSWWVRNLQKLGGGEALDGTLLALRDDTGTVVGMAYYEIAGDEMSPLGFLWYLATDPTRRNQGLGSAAYQAIVARLLDTEGCLAMIFEIEIADDVAQRLPHEPEASDFARRREAWYKRNGAVKLTGVHYEQSVGWQPAIPMSLMLHSRQPLIPEEAFAYAQQLTDVTQTGSLGLEAAPV